MRRTFLSLFVLACIALPLQAQLPLGFGLKGGARLTDFTASSSDVTTADHVYTIGPYAELRLPFGLSIEADLLYKKSGSTLVNIVPLTGLASLQQFDMDSFDVPLLLKKKFDTGMIFRPFVEAGLANRYSTGIPGPFFTMPTPIGGNPAYGLYTSTTSGWQEGLVLGGGVQFKILMVKISGELRWSRYGNISASTVPKLNANQAELLLGIGL
ncbi:MAG: outer membrane beta-barrel protein [Bryobacteraceae bacterium]